MSKLRNKFIVLLTVLLCAMLAFGTAFLVPISRTATAARSGSWTEVGGINNDLWIGGDNPINGNLLDELYKEIIGTNTTYSATFQGVAQYVNSKGTTGVTSADIRGNHTDGHNVSIWFGGIKWDVVYITTVRSDSKYNTDSGIKGNIVVDLWQSTDNITEKSKYSQYTGNDQNSDYPSNMYSTSFIRTKTLNVGGYYLGDGGNLTETKQDKDNKYARFTMSTDYVSDSVRDFLVQPKDVAYQETETAVGNSTCPDLSSNDAYGTPSKGSFRSGFDYSGKGNEENGTAYDAWKNDYVWIPSVAETGDQNAANQNGIWKTDSDLRYVESEMFLRSTTSSNHYQVNCLPSADGNIDKIDNVRPAIHLNLTQANGKASTLLTAPWNVSNYYNGLEQTLSDLNSKPAWYTDYADLYADSPNEGNKPVTVTYPEDMIDISEGYEVKLTITDEAKAKYRWADSEDWETDTERSITYEITKKPIGLILDSQYTDKEPTPQFPAGAIADRDNNDEGTAKPVIEFLYTGGSFINETNFKNLTRGDYTATARIKSDTGKNYVLDKTYSTKVTISASDIEITDSDIVWRYENKGTSHDFDADASGRRAVRYNGFEYTLTIDRTKLPNNDVVVIDESKGTNNSGYLNNVQLNHQEGYYETTVYLKTTSDDYELPKKEFKVRWYIDQGLYDLSDVEWDYTTPFTYDPTTTDYRVNLVIGGLKDEGLSFSFISGSVHIAYGAGTYVAKISLSTTNNNYKKPEKNVAGTYIYNGNINDGSSEDFPWELEWTVNKLTIDFQWLTGREGKQVQNRDEQNFYVPEVIDPEHLVNVTYYKRDDFDFDAKKLKSDAQPVDFADMEVAENQQQSQTVGNYIAILEFKSGLVDNYQFGTGWYMEFNTYDTRSTLTITMVEDEFVYDGNAHGVFGTDVTATGAAQSAIDAYVEYEYFKVTEGVETSVGTEAPVNAGTYKIKIKVIEAGESLLVINGDSEFAVTIKPRILSVPTYEDDLIYNGTEQDIPALVGLPEDWENYLEITIVRQGGDSPSGHTVKNTGVYTVTFTIKSAGNVEWDTDSFKTDPKFVSITVKQLVLHAKEWKENGYYTKIVFEETNADQFVTYKMYNSDGEEVDMATFYSSIGQSFTAKVSIGEEHGDNVKIEYADGVTSSYEFIARSEGDDGSGGNSGDNNGDDADLAKKKQEAKDALEKAAQSKKEEIDNSDMSDEEKAKKKAEVDAELASGKDAIDAATSESGINSSFNEAKKNIENIEIGGGGSSFPWWIIALVAGVLALAAVLIIVIVKRRQTADGDDFDDYYDDEYDFDEDIEEDYDDGDDF